MLTARPWNRFDPTNGPWYLVPSPEWPAYRHSKLAFTEKPEGSGILRCTFYVEKGADPSLASAYPSGKRLVMNSGWAWYRIMQAMAAGEIDGVCRQVADATGASVNLWLDAGYLQDPESHDRVSEQEHWSYLTYDLTDGELCLTSAQLGDPDIAPLQACRKLTDLPSSIEATREIGWKWANLELGVECQLAPLEPAGRLDDAWGGRDLWRRVFAPWTAWLC